MSHEIVPNVPIPEGNAARSYKYPFREMAVGDCIELFDERQMAAARNAAWREKKRTSDFNYTAVVYGHSSNESRDGRNVYGRLWRIAAENGQDDSCPN